MYRHFLKRLIDFVCALLGFVILLPVFIVVTIVLMVNNDGKPFFFQPRIGKNNRVFRVIKFKTMNDRKDKNGELLPDRDRLTPVGRFVRNSSLDELPQLINVIKGDMSLIGPRPLLIEYLPLYNSRQIRRHEVTPGITGWAQINGRNAISWAQKFDFDVWYVENQSFRLDFKILFLTFMKIFRQEGISSATSATMEKFTGSPEKKSVI